MKQNFLVPVFLCISAILACAMGTIFRLRLLPFLRPDTILSGGKLVSTEQLAHVISNLFYVAAAATVVLAAASLISLLRAKRRQGDR
jgi:hypothetical protein